MRGVVELGYTIASVPKLVKTGFERTVLKKGGRRQSKDNPLKKKKKKKLSVWEEIEEDNLLKRDFVRQQRHDAEREQRGKNYVWQKEREQQARKNRSKNVGAKKADALKERQSCCFWFFAQ